MLRLGSVFYLTTFKGLSNGGHLRRYTALLFWQRNTFCCGILVFGEPGFSMVRRALSHRDAARGQGRHPDTLKPRETDNAHLTGTTASQPLSNLSSIETPKAKQSFPR